MTLSCAAAPAAAAPCAQDELVDHIVARGRAHLDAGENDLALELFEQADAETRGALSTRMWIARTWFAQGRINDAFDLVDALAQDHEGPDLDYLYGMGSYLKARGYIAAGVPNATTGFALQDAQTFLAAATAADAEKYHDAWLPLAEAAWFNGDLEVAEAAAARAVALAGDDAGARFLAARVDFSRYTAKKVDEATREEAQAHLRRSIEGFREAARLVEPSEENAALLADVHRNLGIALQWSGASEAAVEAYAEAISWNADALPYADYWGSLGLEDFLRVLEAGAARYAERWGTETTADATLLWWLGSAYYSKGEHERCERTYRRVLEKWPAYVNSWFYVGMSRYHREDYDGAILAWHEHWKADPADLVASVQSDRELHLSVLDWLVGWCAGKGQEPGTEPEYNVKAAFLCEVRAAVHPENWVYWNDWGLFARDGGDFLRERGREGDAPYATALFETAWKAYREAIDLAPDRPHLYNDAAVVLHYYLERDHDVARELYEKARAMATAQLERGGLSEEERALAETARRDATANLEALGERRGGG